MLQVLDRYAWGIYIFNGMAYAISRPICIRYLFRDKENSIFIFILSIAASHTIWGVLTHLNQVQLEIITTTYPRNTLVMHTVQGEGRKNLKVSRLAKLTC